MLKLYLQQSFQLTFQHILHLQNEDLENSDSEGEEPSPEALARYLAMRRHTVGVGDSKHEVPDDMRMKLAHYQPMAAGLPNQPLINPIAMLPHTNLPQTLFPQMHQGPQLPQTTALHDPHLLNLPQGMNVLSYSVYDIHFIVTICYII